jgi:hypothetical protein
MFCRRLINIFKYPFFKGNSKVDCARKYRKNDSRVDNDHDTSI